jgi:hypothetical protein
MIFNRPGFFGKSSLTWPALWTIFGNPEIRNILFCKQKPKPVETDQAMVKIYIF